MVVDVMMMMIIVGAMMTLAENEMMMMGTKAIELKMITLTMIMKDKLMLAGEIDSVGVSVELLIRGFFLIQKQPYLEKGIKKEDNSQEIYSIHQHQRQNYYHFDDRKMESQ
jgi:hypothetical protein